MALEVGRVCSAAVAEGLSRGGGLARGGGGGIDVVGGVGRVAAERAGAVERVGAVERIGAVAAAEFGTLGRGAAVVAAAAAYDRGDCVDRGGETWALAFKHCVTSSGRRLRFSRGICVLGTPSLKWRYAGYGNSAPSERLHTTNLLCCFVPNCMDTRSLSDAELRMRSFATRIKWRSAR